MVTAGSAAEPSPLPGDAFAALRLPDFRRFLAGHFLASTGTQLQTVAVGWYLYERTGSALALGVVGLAQVLPIFLLTLPSGHLSDRYDRLPGASYDLSDRTHHLPGFSDPMPAGSDQVPGDRDDLPGRHGGCDPMHRQHHRMCC